MKKTAALLAVVLALGSTLAFDAEAKRLGGGRSAGMQRSNISAPANQAAPAPATPRNAQGAPAAAPAAAGAAAATAAAPKRNWMGVVGGIAAGLGLAALASHFGFGAAMANMLTLALLAMGVLMLVGWFMRKRVANAAPSLAGGPATLRTGDAGTPVMARTGNPGSLIGSALPASSSTNAIPADFDTAAFERNAKQQFLALQTANDARDLDRLRDYLTPEMLEAARAEIAERGAAPQHTEVFGLQAQVLDVTQESERYVVSVRFSGSVRTEAGAAPEDLAETWHLTRSRGGADGWVVAGIQQA
jgi:predicted lipid-binding transport protein (Tim44 family)